MAAKMDITEERRVDHIIGIGSSAGGIEALSLLVAGLPTGLGCAYVIAQHLSPSYKSMLSELLARQNRLPVVEIKGGESPQADTVYVVPPNSNVILKNGHLQLLPPSKESFTKPSINLFFQSLAEEYGENSIGVILSGTGTDGTSGIMAIKAAGGMTFAQSIESAKYAGMPQSALDSGAVDRIIIPEKFGHALEDLFACKDGFLLTDDDDTVAAPSELATLLERVRAKTKIDFTNYKPATLMRRIQRRMSAVGVQSLSEYLVVTESDPSELDTLAKDTLISVTAFFRDKEAFRTVKKYAKEIIEKKNIGEEIRIWVAGCATGEEAYSFAIMFSELLGESFEQYKLQIFATDIDIDALAVSRRGIYPKAAMSGLSPEQVDQFFTLTDDGYQISKRLRDCVVFARQDLAIDPPFLNIDLVSCRNVLIYFNSELQNRVLSMFYYSIVENGFLFLGRSENCSKHENMFLPIDRRTRIYKKKETNEPVDYMPRLRGSLTSVLKPLPKPVSKSVEQLLLESIVAHTSSNVLLIRDDFKIKQTFGHIEQFVSFPIGHPEFNLAKLIVPEFKNDLLTLMYQALKSGKEASSRKKKISSTGGALYRMVIRPVGKHQDDELFLVFFEPAAPKQKKSIESGVKDPEAVDFESELVATREQLQTLKEEIQASNEEMQALNEEMLASNEEMQASNEELEALNEELQATNQELVSVNEELILKTSELTAISADFESLYNTLEFPVMLFDSSLFLRRLNVAAYRNLNVSLSAVGQHYSRLSLPEYLRSLTETFEKAILEQTREILVISHNEQTFKVFISPSPSPTGEIQSVVLAVVDNTDLVHAQKSLEESRGQLLSIMDHSHSIISLKDTAGRYLFFNRRFEEFFSVDLAECLGKTDHQIFSQTMAEQLRAEYIEAMRQQKSVESKIDLVFPTFSRSILAISFPVFDSEGVVTSICMEATDITDKKHAEEQLRLAAKVFDCSGEAIIVTDPDANIVTVNNSFTKITGYSRDEVIGKKTSILKSGKHSVEFYDELWRRLSQEGWWQGEIINRRKNGENYSEWVTINAVHDVDGSIVNYVAIFGDITAIKSSQRRIEYLATHDELTALPNRTLFMDRLKHAIAQVTREKRKLAVLFIDLDNFKNINDTLGHDVGDLILKESATRLKGCIRESDTLARLGGDEFTAIIEYTNEDEVTMVAARIVDFLSASYLINERNLFISCSIGISLFPADGKDSTTLIKNADTAMYRAKESGKGRYQFFAEEMKAVALQQLGIETGLRVAMEKDLFFMNYQPQVNMISGEIVGAEALIRWNDTHLGYVSPAVFIPIAEKAGIISAIGDIVITKVISQIAAWRKQGIKVPMISINVSALQLRDETFVDKLKEKLSQQGVSFDAIGIEITEGSLLDKLEVTELALNTIKEAGSHISIDDFGTGYSSLSYLKRLPITELKIDRSFVIGLVGNSNDQQIVKAIIDMAKAMNLSIVAEGVETAEQAEILKSYGCEIIQGYYFYKPMSSDELGDVLKQKMKE